MTAEQLEKFYSLDNVEGIAYTAFDGEGFQNQTLLSDRRAVVLAESFIKALRGLEYAQRTCNYLVYSGGEYQFVGFSLGNEDVLVLQLLAGKPLDSFIGNARRLIGEVIALG